VFGYIHVTRRRAEKKVKEEDERQQASVLFNEMLSELPGVEEVEEV